MPGVVRDQRIGGEEAADAAADDHDMGASPYPRVVKNVAARRFF